MFSWLNSTVMSCVQMRTWWNVHKVGLMSLLLSLLQLKSSWIASRWSLLHPMTENLISWIHTVCKFRFWNSGNCACPELIRKALTLSLWIERSNIESLQKYQHRHPQEIMFKQSADHTFEWGMQKNEGNKVQGQLLNMLRLKPFWAGGQYHPAYL